MPEDPGVPQDGDDGGYPVPPQFPAPPDVAGSTRRWGTRPLPPEPQAVSRSGPPVEPPEDRVSSLWGPPSDVPPEPDRWASAPAHQYGSTALLDRPAARRPVVAPPVRPAPAAPSQQSWDWERSHGLRNSLLAAAAILLIGSLIAALVVFRSREPSKQSFVEPPPATVTIAPIGPTESTVAPAAPVSLVPVVTSSTTTVPPPAAVPATTAPATTRATTATTRRVPTPTVTASPPYAGCPPCPTTTSTTRRTTTTSSSTSTTLRPQRTG